MKRKIVGIFVCMLLIAATVLPVAGTMNQKIILDEKNQDLNLDERFLDNTAQHLDIGTVTVEVFVRGAPIHGANGIRVGPDGNLYIASVFGHEIVVMDPRNGFILNRIGPEKGVQCPDDLVFGPDGSIYWTDIVIGEVGRLKPDGTYSKQYVAPFVNPIAFNDEGRLFVGQAFIDDGLYEVDPELNDPPQKILGIGNPGLSLNAFDFGPDGLLYAPRGYLNQIIRINVDTAEVEVVTNEATGACKFDSNGELYIAEDEFVYHCDINDGTCTIIAKTEKILDNLAFDANDRIYLTNLCNGSIYKIKKNDQLKLISPSGLIAPGGIVVMTNDDGSESIFVPEYWTVKEFNSRDGKPLSTGYFGLSGPLTASDDDENLILSSWFGNNVDIWNPESKTILETHYFIYPMNAVRFQGDIVVAELGTNSVVRQDHLTGERTILASGFYIPTGLAYTDDDLWVAEWITGIVYQIVADGVVLDSPLIVAGGLVKPEGMTIDHNGNLLVIESGIGQLTRIDPETGDKTILASGLATGLPTTPTFPPTFTFSDVAVGKHGYIYVTGEVENVIYRIRVVPPDFNFYLFNWFLDRFPNLFPILRLIAGLKN
jgi:sugar lactone lactonase YvrE